MKNQKIEREIIIDTEQAQERRVAVVEDKQLEEYYIERDEQHRHMGSVYKGRVENIIPAINAAFIDIGLEKNGFIHIDDVFASNLDAMELDDEDEEEGEKKNQNQNQNQNKNRPKNRKDLKISDILKEKQEIIVQVVKEPISTKGCRLTTDISLPGRFLVQFLSVFLFRLWRLRFRYQVRPADQINAAVMQFHHFFSSVRFVMLRLRA